MSSTDPNNPYKRYIFGFTLQQLIVIAICLIVLVSFIYSYRNTQNIVQNLNAKLDTINSKLDGIAKGIAH
jgi:uncharacterized protein YoxC